MAKLFQTILVIILVLPVVWVPIAPSRAGASIIDCTAGCPMPRRIKKGAWMPKRIPSSANPFPGRASWQPVRVAPETEFQNPRKVEIQGYSGSAMEPFISCDGGHLFFNNSNDPASETDIFWAERTAEDVFRFLGKVPGLNAPPPTLDGVPSMDDADNLFFVSTRTYGATLSTLYKAVFRDGHASAARLVAGNFSRRQQGWVTMDAEISRDGSRLYFANALFTGAPVPLESDLGLARRNGDDFEVTADSDNIFRNVNTGALEYAPSTSRDGLELFFTRFDGSSTVILKSTRPNASEPFSPPEPVTAISGFVEAPSVSCDGSSLYYHRKDGAAFSIYRVTRIKTPSVDTESPLVSSAALSKKRVKRKTDPIVTINWTSSDNTAVASHEILFAEDGVDFLIPVIAGLAGNERSFAWTVPDSLQQTSTGRIKVIARDAQRNAGEAVSRKLKIK